MTIYTKISENLQLERAVVDAHEGISRYLSKHDQAKLNRVAAELITNGHMHFAAETEYCDVVSDASFALFDGLAKVGDDFDDETRQRIIRAFIGDHL